MNDQNYFDHDADIGIIGRGSSLEQSFEQAAKAMFALMGDLSTVTTQKAISFVFEENDIELAFVTWLNLLIANAQEHHLILAHFKVENAGSTWHGEAQGEQWNEKIERGIDVKGATLTMLSVKQINNIWEAKCVVDV
ncbi:archease [Legionella cardiaca]|uniref:Archease n=1 Tax=Legionella cardiaca TaxID=1071983 RepID=A0ABY8ATX1_9GAMM|nr:archease [Legionella cardiaca]WED43889.1 archease [Legionella cardiaca]